MNKIDKMYKIDKKNQNNQNHSHKGDENDKINLADNNSSYIKVEGELWRFLKPRKTTIFYKKDNNPNNPWKHSLVVKIIKKAGLQIIPDQIGLVSFTPRGRFYYTLNPSTTHIYMLERKIPPRDPYEGVIIGGVIMGCATLLLSFL